MSPAATFMSMETEKSPGGTEGNGTYAQYVGVLRSAACFNAVDQLKTSLREYQSA